MIYVFVGKVFYIRTFVFVYVLGNYAGGNGGGITGAIGGGGGGGGSQTLGGLDATGSTCTIGCDGTFWLGGNAESSSTADEAGGGGGGKCDIIMHLNHLLHLSSLLIFNIGHYGGGGGNNNAGGGGSGYTSPTHCTFPWATVPGTYPAPTSTTYTNSFGVGFVSDSNGIGGE